MKSYAENPELTRRLIGFWTGSIFRCEGWSQVCCLHDLSDEQNNRFLALLDVLIQFVYLMGFSSDFRPAFEESYQVEQTKAKSKVFFFELKKLTFLVRLVIWNHCGWTRVRS